MKAIITDNLPGNVHAAAGFINSQPGVAEMLMSLEYSGDNYSTAIFLVERRSVKAFREQMGTWRSTTDRYKAMYQAWEDGNVTAKPEDFPDTPPAPMKLWSEGV